jgi:hypothetical protein
MFVLWISIFLRGGVMGKHLRVKVSVDPDVQQKYEVRLPAQVEFYIIAYLNDPDGWSTKGYFFEPVSEDPNVIIRLVMPSTITKECGQPSNLSCAELSGKYIYLNAERWFHGSRESKLKLDDYRQYLVSHEMGHILGYEHEKCPCKGCKAPVMMQQTLGIGKCIPNTKVNGSGTAT